MRNQLLKTFVFMIITGATARGQIFEVIFRESLDGDASSVAENPSVLDLFVGNNVIEGSVTRSNELAVGDIDFFQFTIETGERLEGVFLRDIWPDDRAFHAIGAGSIGIVPSGPEAGDTSQYLGSAHLDPVRANVNLLHDLANPIAGTGFEPPLGPGTYTYVIQQTGAVVTNYEMHFQVVPEPAGEIITCVFLFAAAIRFRSKRTFI